MISTQANTIGVFSLSMNEKVGKEFLPYWQAYNQTQSEKEKMEALYQIDQQQKSDLINFY